MRVSIQGGEGSFHQAAAHQFFGRGIEIIPCTHFKDVVKITADKKQCDSGVMAIENSIAGSILPNYNLLHKSKLQIIGEIYLQVKHNLLVNKGVKLEDIREVHSHPMALLQCGDFLEKYNWKLIEKDDTALSAKNINQHQSKYQAAIASKLAAEIFDMDIIAANIHTLKNNYTRFLVLRHETDAEEILDADKASICFQTNHSKGSLVKVLSKIADAGINLSKLQSFPIPGSDFKYTFHVDLEFNSLTQFNAAMKEIKPLTEELKLYGTYKHGVMN